MNNFDYESLFINMSLIFAIAIFVLILYGCVFKNNNIELFSENEKKDTVEKTAMGKIIIGGITSVDIKSLLEIKTPVTKDSVLVFPQPTDPKGVIATGEFVFENDKLINILILTHGSGYDGTEKVKIDKTEVNIITDGISSVEITDGGSGYSSVPSVSFEEPEEGGVIATGTAIIDKGVLKSVKIDTAGKGYKGDEKVVFDPPKNISVIKNPTVSVSSDDKKKIKDLIESCEKIEQDKKEVFLEDLKSDKIRTEQIIELLTILKE